MYWTNLFTKNAELTAAEAKKRLSEANSVDSYQLLDVRQPGEYQEKHIPGAILIPLKELPDRLSELDPDIETIVYCRSGARSRSATQLLQEREFRKVCNMTGGILSWQGATAQGDEQTGLEFFAAKSYEDGIAMACDMEYGLQQFYLLAAEQATGRGDKETADLLAVMAKFEEGHLAKLAAKGKIASPPAATGNAAVEGGFPVAALLQTFAGDLTSPQAVVERAMMFEAQAYDMYFRLAKKTDEEQLRTFYLEMAAEERKHLDKLSDRFDNLLT